jgi:2-methylaconitate cis-trans-isomerase PrpF
MMNFGDQIRTPTVLYRGGTSKAFFVDRDDLPSQDREEIAQWILAIYGSPDPRQIDGVGGADGLTSKFAILGSPTRPDADIDYWFAQVGIDEPTVDWSLICGNISSAVGPYAIERGMVAAQAPSTLVRIHNVNTGKIIRAEVPVENGRPRVIGDQRIDGVPGSGAPIQLDLSESTSTQGRGLLPTGNVRDTLSLPGLGEVEFTLVDVALPSLFLRAERFGFTGNEGPLEIEAASARLADADLVRRHVAAEMGWASSPENARKESPLTPAIVLVSPPQPWEQYGSRLARGAEDCDFTARWVSVRQAHKAGPVTGSVCTGVAAALRGSVVNDVVRPEAHVGGRYRVAHPSGVIDVVIDLDQDSSEIVIRKAAIIRTARRLLEGFVYASKERLPFLGRDPGHEVAA